MSTEVILVFALLPLLAYFVKGIVGAASAIVFNAVLLLVIAFGHNGDISLHDGLYWVGMADFITSAAMAWLVRRELRLERQVLLLLAGMLPVSVLFSLLLERIELDWLLATLSVAITASGLWLIYSRGHALARERSLERAALPTGVVSGVLSGLFSMAGPVVIVFLAAGSKDPVRLRARLVFISLCATATRLATLLFEGAYTRQRLEWFALSLPAVGLGLGLGYFCSRYVQAQAFRVLLGTLVAVAGVAAAVKTFA